MKESIEIIESGLFAGVVADEIVATIKESVEERGNCYISLAGGSTPGAVYRTLAKPPRVKEVDWSKVSLFWGDERWVAHSDTQSNFKMVSETLLQHLAVGEQAPKIYPVNTALASPELAAKDYQNKILNIMGDKPVFDLVLLGLGEDGHTASIFPGSELIKTKRASLCQAVINPNDGSQRISMGLDLLLNARRIAFLVKGAAKSEILKDILEGQANPDIYPARAFLGRAEGLTFFVDSEAAAKLAIR